jgi:metal-dependent amidase/aminoacylase/carboxypeptidase family protein
MNEKIIQWLTDHQEEVIGWRRHFHQNPEVSGKEFETQKKIMELLASMGIESQKVLTLESLRISKEASLGKP